MANRELSGWFVVGAGIEILLLIARWTGAITWPWWLVYLAPFFAYAALLLFAFTLWVLFVKLAGDDD